MFNTDRSAPFLDFFDFFRALVSDPGRVSAVAPSSQTLARLITQEIIPGDGPVIELGPGTGAFTRALLARGVHEHDLLLVEYGSDFVRLLQQRFPRARVLWMDAGQLSRHGRFVAPATAVVSGLPLLSMSPRKVTAILTGAFLHLREGGAFYQFTYGPRCPVPRPILDRLGLKASLVGRTVLNIPPASVYRIRRRPPLLHGVGFAGGSSDAYRSGRNISSGSFASILPRPISRPLSTTPDTTTSDRDASACRLPAPDLQTTSTAAAAPALGFARSGDA